MKYVLDSNVAIKWVLPEADTTKAVRFRNEVRRGMHEILRRTSTLWRSPMPSQRRSDAG